MFMNGGPIVVSGCTFAANTTGNAGWGGAVGCFFCEAAFTDCVFTDNVATGWGGAVAAGSAGNLTFSRCVFSGNTEGAAEFGGTSPTLTECTFYGNWGWSVLRLNDGAPLLRNCSFVNNDASNSTIFCNLSSPAIENGILAFDFSGMAIDTDGSSSPILSCCDLFGNAGGDWVGFVAGQFGTSGNISEDPLFCDVAGANLRLNTDSPCAPTHSPPSCDLIGACPVGCTSTPTPVGNNVVVALEPFGALTYEAVATAGETSIVQIDHGSELGNFQAAMDPALVYDIHTTAGYSGLIEVCLHYDEGALQGDEEDLRLLHFQNEEWVDITTLVDIENDIVCGECEDLSLFGPGFSEVSSIHVHEEVSAASPRLHSHPNPMGRVGKIRYELAQSGPARLDVVDAAGRLVRTLVDTRQPAGSYSLRWEGTSLDGGCLPSGVYFLQLRTSGGSLIRRAVVVR